MIIPARMQATLVFYYGHKHEKLVTFIRSCQDKIISVVGSAFLPYPIDQVHGTLVGLEGIRIGRKIENHWFLENYGESRLVSPEELLNFLMSDSFPSVKIKIGGYRSGIDYGFKSRNKSPHERSFSIQGNIAVAMGWSPQASEVNKPVDDLRRKFNELNILHKWHETPDSIDDDFYFVLGRMQNQFLTTDLRGKLENVMQTFLSNEIGSITITLSRNSLALVGYIDTQLPLSTSCFFPIRRSGIGASELIELYPS